MGTLAIIGAILAALSAAGGFAGKALSDKSDRENVNDFGQKTDDSGKGVSVASDVTGLIAQTLSFADGFGTNMRNLSANRMFNNALKMKGPFKI